MSVFVMIFFAIIIILIINKVMFLESSERMLMFSSVFFMSLGSAILIIFHDFDNDIEVIFNIISYALILIGVINGFKVFKKL